MECSIPVRRSLRGFVYLTAVSATRVLFRAGYAVQQRVRCVLDWVLLREARTESAVLLPGHDAVRGGRLVLSGASARDLPDNNYRSKHVLAVATPRW